MPFYWEIEKPPDPTIIDRKPADPNDPSYWPQVNGQPFNTAELREELHQNAITRAENILRQ